MVTTVHTPISASNSNSGGSAATDDASGIRRVSFAPDTLSKKELERQRKRKENLFGIEIAEKLTKEGIFTDLAVHLESLPKQISTIIDEKAHSMLALVTEIQTKTTPLLRFGTRVKKSNGEEVDYAPKVCRDHMKENPVSGSNRIKELDEYKSIVSAFDELILKFQKDGTDLLKQNAELEVKHRKKLLQIEVLQTIADICVSYCVAERKRITNGNPNALEPSLSNRALGWRTALTYICTFDEARRTRLYFTSSDEVRTLFAELKEKADVRVGDIAVANANESDTTIQAEVFNKVSTLFPMMSFNIWDSLSDDEVIRAINQELLVEYHQKNQRRVNEDTQNIVTGTAGVDHSTLKTMMHEEFAKLAKQLERSKYSGGPKTQGPPGTNAGRNSSNGKGNSDAKKPGKTQNEKKVKSKKQQPKKKQQQQQKHPQPKKKQQKHKGKRARDDQDEGSSAKRGKRKRRR